MAREENSAPKRLQLLVTEASTAREAPEKQANVGLATALGAFSDLASASI